MKCNNIQWCIEIVTLPLLYLKCIQNGCKYLDPVTVMKAITYVNSVYSFS